VIDGTRIGQIAAGAMEYLERDYGDVEDAELLDVAMVLAVRVPGDPATTITHVEAGEDAPAWYVIAGLLHGGLTALGSYEKEDDGD
jgi:hypothetical protein